MELFTALSTETAWEWAKNRRRFFTSPLRDSVVGVISAVVTAVLSYAFGIDDWVRAGLVPIAVGLIVGGGLPFLEAAWWWAQRDRVLLEEENQRLRRERAKESQDRSKDQVVTPAGGNLIEPWQVSVEPTSLGTVGRESNRQSSTLAALHKSGVSFTGPAWERAEVRALVDKTVPLRVKVEIHPNVGSGCTAGAHIRVTNLDGATVRGAAFVITNLLVWKHSAQTFAETTDIHQNGPFLEMETGKDALFCGEPKDLGFIRTEHGRIDIQGHRDGGLENVRTGMKGIWQLTGKVVTEDGRTRDVVTCFEWPGIGCPKPAPCPTPGTPTVSNAPEPHRPVG